MPPSGNHAWITMALGTMIIAPGLAGYVFKEGLKARLPKAA